MIRVCKICGKEFEGRANASLCSGTCRLEAKRIYAKEYRQCNSEKIRASQRKWWNNNRAKIPVITHSDNIALSFEISSAPEEKKKKPNTRYSGSKWAKTYSKADRLTKISMLSGALSKYEIAHLSYGTLSTMYETDKYNSLLHRVLNIKKQEELQ